MLKNLLGFVRTVSDLCFKVLCCTRYDSTFLVDQFNSSETLLQMVGLEKKRHVSLV